MQRFILSKKNQITLISGILIAMAYISKIGFRNMAAFSFALVIASVLGAVPIAIQAFQALKVKVVSIDLLVTKVAAFIPGDYYLRGPIFEGLPTLENHRGVAPYVAFLDMTLRYGIDYVFIGDGVIESHQVEWIDTYLEEKAFTIPVVFEESAESLYGMTYTIRKDSLQSLMRLQESREYANAGETIQPQRTVQRVKGSITLDNLRYKRYSGEIQITKRDYPADERVNVIGYIPRKYQLILEIIPNSA